MGEGQHFMRKTTNAAVWLILVLVGCYLPSAADARFRLLKCVVEDAREVVDGTLEQSDITRISIGSEILYDEASDVMTAPGSIRWHFEEIQQGSADNAMVAVRTERGPASTAHMVFRLQSSDAALPFMFLFGYEIQSGRCKPF